MRRLPKLLPVALLLAARVASAQPWAPDPFEPVSAGGLEAVDRALARLSVHARLLVVGAHPDDEDNALMTWVARGLGGEAAYLSLSRGEGGQNLIGTELGVELGVLRTGELLAARRLEGSRQYFARAYDFGYTRSLAETFERWPRDVLLEDAVRVVRRFKPQVVVAVFPADERARHGQHQASAVVAADAFELAGDASLFPEMAGTPWSPAAFYRRAWMRWGEPATHEYSLGALEPISGRSLGQLAVASRSFHRSQDMGAEQLAGPARGGLVWIAGGDGDRGGGPFAGVDTSLAAIVESVPEGAARDETAALLAEVERIARRARERLTPSSVEGAVPELARILDLLRESQDRLATVAEAGAARALVAEKAEVAVHALAAAAGVVLEATADRETVATGVTVEVAGSVWAAGATRVEVVGVEVVEPAWEVTALAGEERRQDGVQTRRFRITVTGWPQPSMPYYLHWPRRGDLYEWRYTREEVRGEPEQPPLFRLRFVLEIAGRPITLVREVVHRYADQAFGERRLPVRVVPPVELELEPRLSLLPGPIDRVELRATVRSNVDGTIEGEVRSDVGKVREGADGRFSLERQGQSHSVPLVFGPLTAGDPYGVGAVARLHGGGQVMRAMRPVSYPHIRPLAAQVRAESRLVRFDLELPALGRIGYVRGASDRVPEVLAAVGIEVELLGAQELERGDLAGLDAIVVGSRAYETEEALRRANPRLLEYVRAGGLLVVQYQQYQFVSGGYAPFPLEILRPHGRVTDETAKVEALVPEHAVFRGPNRITEADWRGWVQERGLYFAGSWDEAYQPLLALADPGREAERGALLVAPVGEGTYVYTGLSFFRQLPAGVPGAIRLFVNLLALGEG